MFMYLAQMLQTLRKDDKGISAVEYGLLAALIAVVIIASVALIGTNLNTTFNTVGAHLTTGS